MGLGDWIMATAQVRELNERTGKRVAVVDRMGRLRWSEAFDYNPRIVAPNTISPTESASVVRLVNAGGARPYIQGKTPTRWIWRSWDIKPGELFLSHQEIETAVAALPINSVIIEPNTKIQDGNKAWLFDRWQQVVDRLPLPWVQLGPPGTRLLHGVRHVATTPRLAFASIRSARLYVGTEGALHHAAAAFGTPSVVLWSEFISPAYTGYATQHNIRKAKTTCGSRVPCASCRASMMAITVDEVVRAIEGELAK